MIHKQFSIYDSGAQAYLPPFILPRDEMAQRTFGDCCNSKEHQFGAHPEDYTLFRLGTWDDETAIFTPEPNGPQTLGNGVEYVQHQIGAASNGEAKQQASISNDASILSGASGTDSSE